MSKVEEKKKEVETDVSKLKGWARIQNQQIRHILITPTFRCAMICYFVFAVVLGAFGAICLLQAMKNHDLLFRYDNLCKNEKVCTIQFTPTDDMKNPKFYYQLENFYANHRNFVKSRNYKQLRGNDLAEDKISTCSPVTQMEDLGESIPKQSINKTPMKKGDVANPCGLIAKYMFDDTFKLYEGNVTMTRIEINETNIAHSVDKKYKFKKPENADNIQWRDVEDEHLMVWYQMETFSTFIKLWGHTNVTMKANETYTMEIMNNYDVSRFDGKKYIYFSEVNAFGGTNKFLGIAFLSVAGLVVLIMLVFIVLYFIKLRGTDIYSTENLNW